MWGIARQQIQAVEDRKPPLLEALASLRRLSLDEFGEFLMNLPDPAYPYLSSILPGMAPDSIQKEWTGTSGVTLLRQSCSFMNFIATNFVEFTGGPLRNVNTLDFGCGWGRLTRLLAYFNDPEFIWGCDAWNGSLQHCRNHSVDRIVSGLAKSDAVPERLPFSDEHFDLVFAFSIFTHLSERSAAACLQALRRVIKPSGLAIITVRPREFWARVDADRDKLLHDHDTKGFAFLPHHGSGDGSYGDASIDPGYLQYLATDWKPVRMGSTLTDPYQVFVVLRPT